MTRRWFLEQCGVGVGRRRAGPLLRRAGFADTGRRRPPIRWLRRSRITRQGQERHFPVHGRRAQPPGAVRLSSRNWPSSTARCRRRICLKGYRAAFINPELQAARPEVQVCEARPVRRGALRTAAALGEDRRRHRHREIDGHRCVQSRSRPDPDEHRIASSSAGPAWARGLPTAWAASRENLPAFVVFSSGKKGPSGGNSCWGSGFLPTVYQGVQFRSSGDPVLYLVESARRR